MDLTNMDYLSKDEIYDLIVRAINFKNGETKKLNKKVANLFFEPSTRTHYSFVSAQMNLGMNFVNFNESSSSTKKGEEFYDTCKTFEAIGYDLLVIRTKIDEYYKLLENINVPIINAGDGFSNHPSQCLLDLMTIYEEFNKLEGLNVCLVGDVLHSRVASSNIKTMKRLGMNVFTSGPKEYMHEGCEYIDFENAVDSMDVIMLLRVQHERHQEKFSISKYNKLYGMNEDRVKKMKDKAIIMHPAPYNRGVELTDYVVECNKSRIFKQMENGVFIRMAILERACRNVTKKC